jgi:hypothetical protein
VRYEIHPESPTYKNSSINDTYNHLNEAEDDDKSEYYDHVSPGTSGIPPQSSMEYDAMNNYTDVIGEGYLQSSETHKN